MKYKTLGNTGLLVSELSFGSWVTFGEQSSVAKVEAAFDIMKTAYEGGVNFFDNAEAYSHGEAETLMGQAFQMGVDKKVWKRSDLVLTTKIFFGAMVPDTHPEYMPHAKRCNRVGLSRKHIIEGTKESLERMGLDYVDVVFCHRFDPVANVEEVVRAFNYVIEQGMAFYWGTSEWSAQEIMEARAVADRLGLIGPCCEQPEYSLLKRDRVEVEYRRLYPEMGLTIWSPLAYGILTGKYKDGIPKGSRLEQQMFKDTREGQKMKTGVEKSEQLRPLAEELGCSLAQLALAWCIANPNVSTVIGGASRVEQVVENLKAVEIVDKLTPEILKKIDEIFDNKPPLPKQAQLAHRVRVQNLRHFDI